MRSLSSFVLISLFRPFVATVWKGVQWNSSVVFRLASHDVMHTSCDSII